MKKEELKINKDNYKGYIELYKSKTILSPDEKNCKKKFINNIFIVFIITYIAAIVTLPITAPIMSSLLISGYIIADVIVFYNYLKKSRNLDKKIMNAIKEKYPYVDTDISVSELRKSLEKARIITYSNNYQILNEEKYENYIKCEEIKEKYLEETKYKCYQINPMITYKELERPKIKKLVR